MIVLKTCKKADGTDLYGYAEITAYMEYLVTWFGLFVGTCTDG